MDAAWAISRLEHFERACQIYQHDANHSGWDDPEPRLYEAMVKLESTAKRILAEVVPDLEEINVRTLDGASRAIGVIHAALGVLADAEEVAAQFGPTGPAISAADLHPWIWQAAATFWDAGQHAVAVEQAAKSLVAHVQQKSGSTRADRELMAEVLSPKPKDGHSRLWWPGDLTSDTWRSRQEGLHLTAQGAFAGIRNVAAHTHEPGWTEQEALEYLAVLSVVARWIDQTEVIA